MNNSEVVIVSSWSVLVSHVLIGVLAALWIYQEKKKSGVKFPVNCLYNITAQYQSLYLMFAGLYIK